jgi:hypothetical protein
MVAFMASRPFKRHGSRRRFDRFQEHDGGPEKAQTATLQLAKRCRIS